MYPLRGLRSYHKEDWLFTKKSSSQFYKDRHTTLMAILRARVVSLTNLQEVMVKNIFKDQKIISADRPIQVDCLEGWTQNKVLSVGDANMLGHQMSGI